MATVRGWSVMLYMEHEDPTKERQVFPRFTTTLAEVQAKVDAIMVKLGCDPSTGSPGMGEEFDRAWTNNYNYGDEEVYSRGYGHPAGFKFAIAYIGEPGWGG